MNECSEVFESIHEELVEIARKSAALIRDQDMPEDQHLVRSAIMQILVECELVPPRIMNEIEKHVHRSLSEMRGK
jgi:hypothetical protein